MGIDILLEIIILSAFTLAIILVFFLIIVNVALRVQPIKRWLKSIF